MDEETLAGLEYIIKHAPISVLNTNGQTYYLAEFIDDDGTETSVMFCSAFSHVGATAVYAKYAVYINEMELFSVVKKIQEIKSTARKPNLNSQQELLAEAIQYLLFLCSQKVIAQEAEAQRNDMVKGFLMQNSQNIYN